MAPRDERQFDSQATQLRAVAVICWLAESHPLASQGGLSCGPVSDAGYTHRTVLYERRAPFRRLACRAGYEGPGLPTGC